MELIKDYDFGVTYYYNTMVEIPTMSSCRYCNNGKHTRFADNVVVVCPVCLGTGEYVTGGTKKAEVRECTLLEVVLTETHNAVNVEYAFENGDMQELIGSRIYRNSEDCRMGQMKGSCGWVGHSGTIGKVVLPEVDPSKIRKTSEGVE